MLHMRGRKALSNRASSAIASLVVLAIAGAASAASLTKRQGEWWTNAGGQAFVAGGGYAYVGACGHLIVYNITTGAEVARLRRPCAFSDFELIGNTLYAAAGTDGLLIYNVSNPASIPPPTVWTPGGVDQGVGSVTASAFYIYCVVGSTIRTIRISDMTQTGSYDTAASPNHGAITGNIEKSRNALVFPCVPAAGGTNYDLAILDPRAAPQNPTFATVWNPTSTVAAVYADSTGNRVCLALRAELIPGAIDGIEKLDLTNPTAPIGAGTASSVSYPGASVVASGDYAYLATSPRSASPKNGELAIYNVSAAPSFTGKLTFNTMSVVGCAFNNDRVVIGAGNNTQENETRFIDVTNKANPVDQPSQSKDHPAFIETTYNVGNYLYEANGEDGMWIFDVANPDAPVFKSQIDSGEVGGGTNNNLAETLWVSADGNVAGLAEGSYTSFVNVSNKTSPSIMLEVDNGGWQNGVMFNEGIRRTAYICSFELAPGSVPNPMGGLSVFDCTSNTLPPVLKTWYHIDPALGLGHPIDLFAENGIVYIAASERFLIFQYSVAPSPNITLLSNTQIKAAPGMGWDFTEAWDVHKSGNYCYLATKKNGGSTGFEGMLVFNVSNPASPSFVSQYGAAGGSEGLWASGNYVFWPNRAGASGLSVINVSNPAVPTLATSIWGPGGLAVMANASNRVFVGGFGLGAPILDFTP